MYPGYWASLLQMKYICNPKPYVSSIFFSPRQQEGVGVGECFSYIPLTEIQNTALPACVCVMFPLNYASVGHQEQLTGYHAPQSSSKISIRADHGSVNDSIHIGYL